MVQKQKLKSIILLQVHLEGASLMEAVDCLRAMSRKNNEREKEYWDGVNIGLIPTGVVHPVAISLNRKNIPLGEALDEVAKLAGMTLKVDEAAVVLSKGVGQTSEEAIISYQAPWTHVLFSEVFFEGASLEEALEFVRVKLQRICNVDGRLDAPDIQLKPGGNPALTVDLKLMDIPVVEFLRYVALQTDHTVKMDDRTATFTPTPKKQALPGSTRS